MWADELLAMAYNILQLNSPVMSFLNKLHTRLSLMTDKTGNIPLKTIIKSLAQHKDDRRKVERALDTAGLPSTKVSSDII